MASVLLYVCMYDVVHFVGLINECFLLVQILFLGFSRERVGYDGFRCFRCFFFFYGSKM